MGQYALPRNVEGSWWQHDVNPGEAYDGRLSENLNCFFNCSLWNIGSVRPAKSQLETDKDRFIIILIDQWFKRAVVSLRGQVLSSFMWRSLVRLVANDHRQCGWSVASGRISLLLLRSSWSVFFEFFRYYCAYLYICIDICIVLCGLLTLGYRLSGYGIGKGGVSLWGILWKMKRSVRFLTAVDSAIVCFFTSFRRVADGNFATSVPSWIIKCTFADRIFRVPNWLQNAVNGALEEIWPVFG